MQIIKSIAIAIIICAPALAHASSAQLEKLARQYVQMPQIQSMVDDMFSADAMAAQIASSLPPGVSVSPEKLGQIGEIVATALQDLRPLIDDQMMLATARHFDTDEIKALISFYRSKEGASVMAKMQPYLQDYTAAVIPQVQQKMQSLAPQIRTILEGN